MSIVICPSCSTKNRIKHYKTAQVPVCGRCGSMLPESAYVKAIRFLRNKWAWIVLLGFSGGAWIADSVPHSKPRSTSKQLVTSCTPAPVSHGIYRDYSSEERIAPFKILTQSGSNYYAKLVDVLTNREIMSIYIIGGRPVEVDVPLGSYRLKYAHGEVWCGDSLLFGELTAYGEAQDTFNFAIEGSHISGYTVELIPQVHGNLRTKSISASDF
jgi:hypothetical protein